MTVITSTSAAATVVQPNSISNAQLDQTAFLRLMTTQLKEQDPFNPMDNTQMVAQMAQFSSVAGISEMNSSLKAISTQLTAQTAILAEIKAAAPNPTATVGA
jgi:flagellar basal-body rod modification protein FlgD